MKATAFEFRFRLWIGLLLYVVGFLAPWERARPGVNSHLWGWLALELFSIAHVGSRQAFLLVTVLACVLAALGAGIRVWGNAYLGQALVRDGAIQTNTLVVAGPYRWMRNPLYLGSWLTGLAVAVLMPPTGALFFVVALTVFELRLIGAEQAQLAAKFGDPYREYARRVGLWFPVGQVAAATDVQPRWGQALAAEIYPVGVAVCFVALAWRYDVGLLTQCVLVCFGASLVARAFLPAATG